MINGQVTRVVGGALVTRTPIPVLAAPDAENAGTETLPRTCAVQGVVPAAVRLASVLGAATIRAAGDDTTDRAELHGSVRVRQAAGPTHLTLVTLECTHVDIAMSVSADGG
ncbi:MAG: hypothetical protein ABI864_07235, partial [Chloroflexota bacterium]